MLRLNHVTVGVVGGGEGGGEREGETEEDPPPLTLRFQVLIGFIKQFD